MIDSTFLFNDIDSKLKHLSCKAFANNDVSKIIRQWSHGTWTSLFTSGSIFLVSQLTVIWLVLLG